MDQFVGTSTSRMAGSCQQAATLHDASVETTFVQIVTSLGTQLWFAEVSKLLDKPNPLGHRTKFAKKRTVAQVGI